ncbi:helix-turn-helix transcriptional regulator [Egibacter rhizosphaerae]|uniref:Helix-turn-helix transcriptional regulator n=1 Tax=Egibacter rhizosphaerae TaxID=1670831 RepID=A0A411YBB5_9ACTN|nr:AAA family ATPase [Egibacter rhizosphaerae]QBI18468.1 helix-turn-helix transcriptional regulator [Egibacter rhizosphaerae]
MLASRPGRLPTMVGRGGLLDELRRSLDAVHCETGPVVALVTGEAGIGKTRLLRELAGELPADVPALVGQAREGDTDRAFGLVRDLAEDHAALLEPVPEPLERWRHPIGHLLDPLVRLADHPDDGHTHSQEELARAGVALVCHLTGSRPAVVVLEDLHWADSASLEVLTRLARSREPLLVVATFRPEDFERRHALARALPELERQSTVRHIPVEPLIAAELHEFLEHAYRRPVDAGVVERLRRRTRGNPFFVEELLDAGAGGAHARAGARLADPEALATAELPWSTSEAALRRLDGIDAAAWRLLEAAAVLAGRVDLATIAAALDTDEAALAQSAAGLVRAGVLEEAADARLGFRHALVADAVAGQVLHTVRRSLHARAHDALRERGDVAHATLAHHAAGAERTDEAAAHAHEAARGALHAGAPREALAAAELALASRRDTELSELAARAAAQIGDFALAAAHAEQWAAQADETGDLEAATLARCHLAWFRWWDDDTSTALAVLGDAVATAETLPDSPAKAHAFATRARFEQTRRHPAAAVETGDRAATIAERIGDRRTLAKAWLHKAGGLLDSPEHQTEHDLAHAADLLNRARDESERHGDVDTLAGSLHNRLVPEQPDDVSTERSAEILADARDVADRYGLERLDHKLDLLATYLAVAAGDLGAAETALVAARRVPLAPHEASWRASLDAYLAAEQSDLDRAARAHAEQLDLGGGPLPAESEVDAGFVLATLGTLRGDADAGEQGLRRVGEHVDDVCPCVASMWWDTALAAVDAGVDPGLVDSLVEREAPPVLPRHAGLVAHARGAVHAAWGRRPESVTALRTAVAAERRGRRATLLADAHHRLSEQLVRGGEIAGESSSERLEEAREHAAAAVRWLEHWPGARRDRCEAGRQRLHVAGRGGGRSGRGDGGGSRGDGGRGRHAALTPRELEVVDLVARGYTNSGIADRLFITRKTASTHVSNLLTKTGLSGRTQLGVWAVREGIAESSGETE